MAADTNSGTSAGGTVWPAGTLRQTRQGLLLSQGRGPPAPHPRPDRRLRHARAGSGLRERLPDFNNTTNDERPAKRRVAGSMVRHSGPPWGVSFEHPHPLGRPGPTPLRSERPWARHLYPDKNMRAMIMHGASS